MAVEPIVTVAAVHQPVVEVPALGTTTVLTAIDAPHHLPTEEVQPVATAVDHPTRTMQALGVHLVDKIEDQGQGQDLRKIEEVVGAAHLPIRIRSREGHQRPHFQQRVLMQTQRLGSTAMSTVASLSTMVNLWLMLTPRPKTAKLLTHQLPRNPERMPTVTKRLRRPWPLLPRMNSPMALQQMLKRNECDEYIEHHLGAYKQTLIKKSDSSKS